MTSFSDFVDAAECDPILIYNADQLPPCTVLARGSAGDPVMDTTFWTVDWSCTPEFVIVITADMDIPEIWLGKMSNVSIDCITVASETIAAMIAEVEPLVCIWNYHKGPRQWCQFGGDEDWTAITRTVVYYGADTDRDMRHVYDRLHLRKLSWLAREEEEGEFSVLTAAHS